MDKKKNKAIEFKSMRFGLSDSNFIKILKKKRDKKSCFIKENIYYYNKNNVFIKNIENLILIFLINIILLNINGIICESYIILKINKSGNYNILFNGNVEPTNKFCYGVSMHIPTSMTNFKC